MLNQYPAIIKLLKNIEDYSSYRNIVYDLAEKYPSILLDLIGDINHTTIDAQIITLLQAGKYVHAVKTCQKHMKSDLKTAKDYVDNLRSR